MTKRAILDLGDDLFRISMPGVDVDEAGDADFLLHEDHLYSQPYYFGWVANPWAPNTNGTVTLSETVQVTVPDVTANPIILLYKQYSNGDNCFPDFRFLSSQNDAFSMSLIAYAVAISSTRVDVTFGKFRCPFYMTGAYMVLMRGPD